MDLSKLATMVPGVVGVAGGVSLEADEVLRSDSEPWASSKIHITN